jgi:hypothetical protein
MANLSFSEEAARRLREQTRKYRDLDRYAAAIGPGKDPDFIDPEAQTSLAILLANSYFGEEDIFNRTGKDRAEYYRRLAAIDPRIFRLMIGDQPSSLRIVDGMRIEPGLDLGHVVGYSTVIPLSREGYDAYIKKKVSAFEFDARHVADPASGPPPYIFIEGAFHISYFLSKKYEKEVRTDESRGKAVKSDMALDNRHLFEESLPRHVLRFFPPLQFHRGEMIDSDPPGHLPEVFCSTEHSDLAELLEGRLGFEWAGVRCDLRLIREPGDVRRIPASGENLVIISLVGDVLHFRIFDSSGKKVTDTDEKKLTRPGQSGDDPGRRIEELRGQLDGLWPPRELTRSEKGRVITAVASIVGHTIGVGKAGLDIFSLNLYDYTVHELDLEQPERAISKKRALRKTIERIKAIINPGEHSVSG